MATSTETRRAGAHDPEGRRADVLVAARRLFAAHGYAQTSVRAIAAEAEVNPALVVTYFGGKEALFLEAVGRFEVPPVALQGDVGGLGARLAHLYVERWEHLDDGDPWPALVRSALSHDASRELLRSELARQLADPLAEVLGTDGDGPARNAMVQCLIGGTIMERYLLALEPACSLPAPVFEAALASSLQHAIDGPLGGGDAAPLVGGDAGEHG